MDHNEQQGGSSFSYDTVTEALNFNTLDAMENYLLKGLLETDQENIALIKENSSILSQLSLEVKALPNDIKEDLDKIASVMRTERVYEFDEIAIRISRERRILEEKVRQREERNMLLKHSRLCKIYERLLKKLEYMEDSIHSIENTTASCKNDDLSCKMMFLSAKLKEYQETVKKLEYDLSEMEVEELYPEKIMEKYKLYLERSQDLVNVKQFFDVYRDLPPNLTGAKLMLEGKRKELEELEQQISKRMNN